MEIAISLAIIGIALVAIIGVLPYGMNVQQENRQETTIDEDANVFMEAIRNGSLGLDDLTNYVYLITNNWGQYNASSGQWTYGANIYTYSGYSIGPGYYYPDSGGAPLTNGANIIGLMSTPEFVDPWGNPTNNLLYNVFGFSYAGYSNHVVAYCYSISGPALDKPPQDNSLVRQDSFGYRIYCVNAPFPVDTNAPTPYDQELTASLHELRLSFEWPQLPSGALGPGRQTFNTLVAGQLQRQPPTNSANPNILWNTNFYFYQPQWFNTNSLTSTP